jgi:hypothetical protein
MADQANPYSAVAGSLLSYLGAKKAAQSQEEMNRKNLLMQGEAASQAATNAALESILQQYGTFLNPNSSTPRY